MKRGAYTFDVFVTASKAPASRTGAPKRYIGRGLTEAEARELCADYRAKHEPGLYSRKVEYESAE